MFNMLQEFPMNEPQEYPEPNLPVEAPIGSPRENPQFIPSESPAQPPEENPQYDPVEIPQP